MPQFKLMPDSNRSKRANNREINNYVDEILYSNNESNPKCCDELSEHPLELNAITSKVS